MQIIPVSLLGTYLHFFLLVTWLVMGTILFFTWLEFFKQDTIDFLVVATLVVATLLWPLVVPLAYLELISKNPYFKK
jgi:hypothetical protein